MVPRATGNFDVELQPQSTDEGAPAGIGRMSIDKRFAGDLTGTSRGLMMTAAGTTAGSAGYVAIERVTGTIDGRAGEFVLQHFGVMRRGEGTLTIEVVPDSGTDELQGLTGTMTIDAAANHAYVFDYDLPDPSTG
jgi:hypothetical protein